jgi:hypothetical protein
MAFPPNYSTSGSGFDLALISHMVNELPKKLIILTEENG